MILTMMREVFQTQIEFHRNLTEIEVSLILKKDGQQYQPWEQLVVVMMNKQIGVKEERKQQRKNKKKVSSIVFNPFTLKCLKYTLPSLKFDIAIVANSVFSQKSTVANSVDTDETAHYEPSRLDLHCCKCRHLGL